MPDRPSRETGSDEPSIGQIGRFDLKQLLGGGGFGLVFRAYDPVLGRAVAVKVPRFSRHDKKKLQRFVLEAQAAGKLRHPNIVTVFESGESQGKYYIASEYVPGVPLSEQIQIARPTFEQSAQWLGQLADALDYAHREGILHRDIKPANIMIDAKKRPQIMDFGLAKLIDQDSSQTIEGSLLGTPAYMSPEQARGALEEVGPHSDQYSLGVVMYELITGVRPFSGAPHEVIAQVLADTPPAPREVNPEIPADLEAICLKTMAKPPSERYADTASIGRRPASLSGGPAGCSAHDWHHGTDPALGTAQSGRGDTICCRHRALGAVGGGDGNRQRTDLARPKTGGRTTPPRGKSTSASRDRTETGRGGPETRDCGARASRDRARTCGTGCETRGH